VQGGTQRLAGYDMKVISPKRTLNALDTKPSFITVQLELTRLSLVNIDIYLAITVLAKIFLIICL